MALLDRLFGEDKSREQGAAVDDAAEEVEIDLEALTRAMAEHQALKSRVHNRLFDFIDFSRIGGLTEDRIAGDIATITRRILSEEPDAARRCERILTMLLTFSDRNPGITRVLIGEALVGEHERLRTRVSQFFDRLETQLKQVLREGEQAAGMRLPASVAAIANLLMAVVEGRMTQFSRSAFEHRPLESWEHQWQALRVGVFSGIGQ